MTTSFIYYGLRFWLIKPPSPLLYRLCFLQIKWLGKVLMQRFAFSLNFKVPRSGTGDSRSLQRVRQHKITFPTGGRWWWWCTSL